jgi:hypothetical protein
MIKHLKTLTIILFIITGAFILHSCETEKTVQITVLESETKEPLDSVYVQFNAGKNNDYTKSGTSGYTNENGSFTGSFMIGCSFGCYEYYFECSKARYEIYTSEFNVNNKTVYLERE